MTTYRAITFARATLLPESVCLGPTYCGVCHERIAPGSEIYADTADVPHPKALCLPCGDAQIGTSVHFDIAP